MATVTYTISGTTATMSFTATNPMASHPSYRISYSNSGTVLGYTDVDSVSGSYPIETELANLTEGTSYNLTWTWAYYDEGDYVTVETGTVQVDVPDNTPRAATQSQWEDLIDRIKAKSDVVITMTTTDPGEGAPTTANSFTAVYQ